ncbi:MULTISPECIES: AEC family transporter [unclassified Marinomonas]|jgi:malonate transporter and related proteins|uniref:Auxin Efflux Carrier n=1 Tax=Marinomonas sp. (strain MWYL1) TaxID=400668 RepID=A6VZA6_MARMS|nr:AEC family transporter [Marinomonas sp. UCMA 3892]
MALNNFLDVLVFSFSITMPIFMILALGVILYRIRIINDNFIDVASKLVFNVTLPALLFISISKSDISSNTDLSLVIYAMIAVTVTYIALELLLSIWEPDKAERAVLVQGAFRSNMGIIGLAYCVNAYGNNVFSVASVYLGGVTILFNILSVIGLSRALGKNASLIGILKGIAKNPLIIAILAAFITSLTGLSLPSTLYKAGDYFAQMTLPLALLCAGASLNFKSLKSGMLGAILASVGKLIFIPFILTFGGYLLGYRGMELGVLFLMSSAPTASASYIMVRAMNGNSSLAANIIVITTIASLISTSIGVTLLRSFNLI